uniref:Transcriptional regulatory protein n=1 Tax=Panagrellus redivivus TaxID=6233 RepID=A0A7E4ZT02_PANRE
MLSLGRLVAAPLSRRQLSLSAELLKGHSKWQNIKATKGKNDLLKSQKTNLLLRRVKTAVSTGGYDLKLNRKLADLQLEFKSLGLSLDTFNNYLVKLKNKPDLTFHYDLIGPSGSFFIIEAEGENKSKIQSQIAKSIKKIGGFRFAADSLQNRFEAKGIVHISAKTADGKTLKVEDVEELAIELDCEEVTALNDDGEKLEFTTEPNNVSKLESELAAKGYTIELAETQLIPLHAITVSEAESTLVEKFYEALQDVEEVKQIFDNIDSSEGTAAAATA